MNHNGLYEFSRAIIFKSTSFHLKGSNTVHSYLLVPCPNAPTCGDRRVHSQKPESKLGLTHENQLLSHWLLSAPFPREAGIRNEAETCARHSDMECVWPECHLSHSTTHWPPNSHNFFLKYFQVLVSKFVDTE